jgi:signal peptidase I
MTNDTLATRLFCRIYAAMLYAYPREFRVEYGTHMQQAFRDRFRHSTKSLLRLAAHSVADWLVTVFREGSRSRATRTAFAEWAVTILIYLFATTTMVQAYVVPTGSMEKNLRIGDHMLVDRLVYADPGAWGRHVLPYHEAQRGDIVAFLYPEDVRQTYVKRLIGLPGDRIRLIDKQVIRNGRRLIEPYTQHIDPSIDPYRDDFPTSASWQTTPRGREMFDRNISNGEVVVPPGMLFMMGDNRENSADSRYWGFVPREYVVGKPLVIYWSYDAPTEDLQEWTLTHVFDVLTHFATKTRWERTLMTPRSQSAQEVDLEP